MEPLVSVTIVTYNSGRYLDACLESLRLQDYPRLEIILVDNCSQDGSAGIARRHADRLALFCNSVNTGFCRGQNQAIAASHGEWVLALNPDVVLEPHFVSQLIAGIEAQGDPKTGIACGRLASQQEGLLDSTGIYFTPELRHLDRDCRQPDRGQRTASEYVFGATGAAALYRREMIEAISVPGQYLPEFFDEEFFAYRDDADVAWRAQLLGWNCLYIPEARATHVRTCLPENRAQMHPLVNMHSVKNRFLMRIKNIGARLYARHFLAITRRDLEVLGYCLMVEHSSLPGLRRVIQELPRTLAKRRWIQSRRVRSDRELAHWFNAQQANQAASAPGGVIAPAAQAGGRS